MAADNRLEIRRSLEEQFEDLTSQAESEARPRAA